MIERKQKKIFKKIIIVFIALLLAFSFLGCGKEEPEPTQTPAPTIKPTPTPAPETSMTKIQDRGELVVACEAAKPPYIYVNRVSGDFEILGPDIELAKEIAKSLDVPLVIKSVKINDIFIGLELGLYDMAVGAISPTDELRQVVDFSTEFFKDEYPIIINQEFKESYVDLKSFKDKRFGVLRRTIQSSLVKEQVWYPRMKNYDTETIMIDNLMTNYLAAVCLEPYRARYYLDKFPDLIYMGISLSDEEVGGKAIAIPKGKEDFVEYVNELMAKLEEDKFLLKQLGISETDYDKNLLEIDSACSDYLGILYGK